MWGLILAVIFVVILTVKESPWQETYLRATRFLFWWYVVWAVVTVAFLLIGIGAGTALASLLVGPLAALLGAGVVTVAVLSVVAALSVLQVLGAYLLRTALHQTIASVYEWRAARLVVGAILVFVGVWNFSS